MFQAMMSKYIENKTEFLTLIVAVLTLFLVLFTIWLVYIAMAESETQRFNTAWLLLNYVNPSGPTCEKPQHNENEIAGGGRQDALYYLKDHGISMQGADISRAIFSYAALDKMDLNRSTMCYTDLFGSDLRASSLWGGHMSNANLQFAQLQGADLEYADLTCADMRGAHLQNLSFSTVKWIMHQLMPSGVIGYDMMKNDEKQNIVRTNMKGATLKFSHLEGADLRNAILVGAKLNCAHFGHYTDTFENSETCWRKSVGLIGLSWLSPKKDPALDAICRWFRNNVPKGIHAESLKPKFCEAADRVVDHKRLGERKLSESEVMSVTGADLSNAILTGACLRNADLSNAILTGADLRNADLRHANLTNTDLTDANLTNTDLTDAINVRGDTIVKAKCLCNTLLPTDIVDSTDIIDAQNLRNRNCGDKKRCDSGWNDVDPALGQDIIAPNCD